jgi:hypothetical protein
MKILITNWVILNNSGTELYVKELAIELKKRGHDIEIFTRFKGKLADELNHQNINVVTNLSLLKNKPDIIHAHHNILASKVASYFKKTPIVLFIHDRTSYLDYPLIHKNIMRYVAVDYNCRERYLLEGKFKEEDIDIIFNWYNPERFTIKNKINPVPKKALIFSNYIDKGKIFLEIQAACKSLNIHLDIIGFNSGNQHDIPELILNNYDIVFAKAKAGIEALSTANALIVCDYRGLGGMVTPENVEQYRNFNFGMKLMTKPIRKDLIINEIKKYNSTDIEFVSQYIRSASNFFNIVTVIENMYKDAFREFNFNKGGIRKGYFFNHLYIILINYGIIFLFYLSKNIALYNFVRKVYKYCKK